MFSMVNIKSVFGNFLIKYDGRIFLNYINAKKLISIILLYNSDKLIDNTRIENFVSGIISNTEVENYSEIELIHMFKENFKLKYHEYYDIIDFEKIGKIIFYDKIEESLLKNSKIIYGDIIIVISENIIFERNFKYPKNYWIYLLIKDLEPDTVTVVTDINEDVQCFAIHKTDLFNILEKSKNINLIFEKYKTINCDLSHVISNS